MKTNSEVIMNKIITGPSTILAKMIGYSGKQALYNDKTNQQGLNDIRITRQTNFMGGFFEIFIPPTEPLQLKKTKSGFEADYPATQEFDHALLSNLLQCASFLRNNSIRQKKINWIRTLQQIVDLEKESRPFLILHLADADSIDKELELLDIYYALGVRSLGITWSRQNQFGYGAPYKFPGHPDIGPGLTPTGKKLITKCNELGIMIDNAHLNEAGFNDVAENSIKPLVISHGTPHTLNPSSRSFTDNMLETIASTNGIVGISLEGVKETADGYARDMVRHIEYVMNKVGEKFVGFGSDMVVDPNSAGNITTLLSEVLCLLESRGFHQAVIKKIAYQNWQRVFDETF